MIYDYPPIKEHELYFSYLLRYHMYTGNSSLVSSFREMLGIQSWSSNVSFISRVGESLSKIRMEKEEYLEYHSVFPFYRLFLQPEKYQEIKRFIFQNNSISYINKLHAVCNREDSLAGNMLKYCPICHKEEMTYSDLKIYQQIPWVKVCVKHGCYLNSVSAIKKKPLAHPEEWDVSARNCEEQWMLWIAEDVKFILEERPELFLEDVTELICWKIQKMQETETIESIEKKLLAQYEMLPKQYQCYRKRFSLKKFLERPIRQDISQMEYLLLIRMLFGSFQKFVEYS